MSKILGGFAGIRNTVVDQIVRQHEEIEYLHQQLAKRDKHVTLLREKFQELVDNIAWNGDDYSYQFWVVEVAKDALAATEPKT